MSVLREFSLHAANPKKTLYSSRKVYFSQTGLVEDKNIYVSSVYFIFDNNLTLLLIDQNIVFVDAENTRRFILLNKQK